MDKITRLCAMCSTIKYLEEFTKHKGGSLGRTNRCLQCHRMLCRIYKRDKTGRGIGSEADRVDRERVEIFKQWRRLAVATKRCSNCQSRRAREGMLRCEKCLQVLREARLKPGQEIKKTKQEQLQDLKQKLLEMYGQVCFCCEESNQKFLTFVCPARHPTWRKQKTKRVYEFYLEKKVEGMQTLCWNCSLGRQMNKGVCPHVQKKENV